MTLLQKAKERFLDVIREHGVPASEPLSAEPLGVEEAIGDPAPYKDFALQRGVERLLEVSCRDARGQAFSFCPCRWRGTLEDVISLQLSNDRNRALLIATMNAAGRALGLVEGTIHCKDNGPQQCAVTMAEMVADKYGLDQCIGIVGYQPAILDRFVRRFGSANLRLLDLHPANIGRTVHGATIWDGEKLLERMADECNVCLATGSALANGTLDRILEAMHRRSKKVLLYGTTIAFPAVLLNMERLCFKAI